MNSKENTIIAVWKPPQEQGPAPLIPNYYQHERYQGPPDKANPPVIYQSKTLFLQAGDLRHGAVGGKVRDDKPTVPATELDKL